MLLLETAIMNTLMKIYNDTNNIDKACEIIEYEFQGIKVHKDINNSFYKVNIYSAINNNLITTIDNIPIKNK